MDVTQLVLIVDGLRDERINSEIAVILGSKVNEDGTLSPKLQARLDAGFQLYKDGIVSHVMVSGGLGKEGFYEGDKMAEYLILQGIPEDKITIDNYGDNTMKTAQNFARRFSKTTSVIVVSQFYHITRCKWAFRKVGFKKVSGVHCDYFEIWDVYGCIREFFEYYGYLMVK